MQWAVGQMHSHMGSQCWGQQGWGMWGHLPTVALGVGSPGCYGASLHVCCTGGSSTLTWWGDTRSPCCLCRVGARDMKTPPSPGVPGPCTLQEEARHAAIKNITSVLFGICYSARVTGYKYILQRASSPSALRGGGAGAGCGADVVLAPGSRASRAIDALAPGSRASRHRCVTAASTGSVCQPDRLAQGQDTVSPQGPVPFSCLPRPQVLVLTLAGLRLGYPHVGSPAAPSPCPATPKPLAQSHVCGSVATTAQQMPQPHRGTPSPTQAASPPESPYLGVCSSCTSWMPELGSPHDGGKGPSGSNLGGRVDGEQLALLLSPHSCRRLQTTGSAFSQQHGQGGHSMTLGQW